MSSLSPSRFLQRLDEAAFWESWVGMVLTRAGLWVVHHPMYDGKHEIFANTWDLDVSAQWPDVADTFWPRLKVEVKSHASHWTSPNDYHGDRFFGPDRKMVCSVYSWMNKCPGKSHTDRDYLFVSKVTGSVIWLPTGSPVNLGGEVWDQGNRRLEKIVYCDSSTLRPLDEFVEHVKEYM